MSANLPQQFRNAEKQYRNCSTAVEELECLQRMLRETPKHKGTDKLRANLKRKISQVKSAVQSPRTTGVRSGLTLPRQGAGRVVLIGGPNSGKSRLLATLTDSAPHVASFPFTTRVPLPGLMPFEDVKIQLVDTSPIIRDNYSSQTASLVRSADLVLCLADLESEDSAEVLVDVINTVQKSRSRLANEGKLDANDIGVTYTKTFLVWTKIDAVGASSRHDCFRAQLEKPLIQLNLTEFEVSAENQTGLAPLKKGIFDSLNIVRVYTKDPSKKEPDLEHPLTLTYGSEVIHLAGMVHQELANQFHSARIWGKNKHDGTIVNSHYILQDRDVVEIKTR